MLKVIERHGSRNLYLRGTVRGISVDESTGVSCPEAAEEIRVIREAEILKESIHGKRAVVTFSQAALSYLELGGEVRFMEPLLRYFANDKMAAIRQAEIDTAALKLYPGRSPDTLNRQVYTPMSAVIKHAARRGWCDTFKLERPPQGEGRVRWITHEQADALIDACADHIRPLVVFLLYTGARIGEALWLDWHHLDLDARHVEFLKTKNGLARGVPLHSRIVQELRGTNNREGCVFRNRLGVSYAPLDQENPKDTSAGNRIRKAFGSAVRRAGIVDFTPHDCRHTWATWHYRANRDLGALQKLGGWKTLSMVFRYAHTNVAELSETIERI